MEVILYVLLVSWRLSLPSETTWLCLVERRACKQSLGKGNSMCDQTSWVIARWVDATISCSPKMRKLHGSPSAGTVGERQCRNGSAAVVQLQARAVSVSSCFALEVQCLQEAATDPDTVQVLVRAGPSQHNIAEALRMAKNRTTWS